MKHYDLIIIGSGGGTKLRAAADMWKKVAIIEKDELGGTCLNKGCIPSKMLIYPADFITRAREDAHKLHITWLEEPKLDFEILARETTQTIRTNSESIRPIYDMHPNIDFYHGHARFLDNTVIEVWDIQLTWDKIYIATGSKPRIPEIEWLTGTPFMTSKEALRNTKLPKSMIIIGGGYIAVELWHAYAAAWTEVQFLVRSGLIQAEDSDIREAFTEDFSKRYNVHLWVRPTRVEYKDSLFRVTLLWSDGEEVIMTSEALLVATWVVPNTENLWLENTHITTSAAWYIEVDEYLETKQPGVYALGDVVGNYLFRHSVNYEGEYLLRNHYENTKQSAISPIEYPPVPHAIFSYPQVAWVWVTEDELIREGKVRGHDYEVAIHYYRDSAMGMAMKPQVWLVKLIAEKNTWKILWAHILGDKAADIIHMMIVIISAWETVDFMLDRMIFIHPALSEVIRNAARSLKKKL